jgi:hypothetical protein
VSLSLATSERVRCLACGHDGPPAPEVAERLREAGVMLRGLDVRERQLDASQAAAIQRALGERRTLRLVVALTSLLPALWGAFFLLMFLLDDEGERGSLVILLPPMLLPLAIYGGLVVLVLRHAGRKREGLLALCAAEAPGAPGEPASCHVCGAPLVGEATHAVARCSYCEADNVVDPQALDAARRRRESSVGSIEQAVQAEARAATFASVGAGFGAIAALIAAPLVGLGLTFVLWFSVGMGIAIVDTEQGRCVGRVAERKGAQGIDLGKERDKGARVWLPRSRGVAEISLNELIGRRVLLLSGVEGTVEKFRGDFINGQNLLLSDKGQVPVEGVCLVDPSAAPASSSSAAPASSSSGASPPSSSGAPASPPSPSGASAAPPSGAPSGRAVPARR